MSGQVSNFTIVSSLTPGSFIRSVLAFLEFKHCNFSVFPKRKMANVHDHSSVLEHEAKGTLTPMDNIIKSWIPWVRAKHLIKLAEHSTPKSDTWCPGGDTDIEDSLYRGRIAR